MSMRCFRERETDSPDELAPRSGRWRYQGQRRMDRPEAMSSHCSVGSVPGR